MKKYLMTGVTTLAMCAALTSCSHDEIGHYTQAEIAQAKYEAAFVKAFGQPATNQDWGFGASTRTRSVYADGNEWAASDGERWAVPPVLTEQQKAVVKKYFQTVKNPTYEDPEWTNYFMQQVYKGGEDPGANSTEKYKAADGQTDIIGSDHMDHLAAIDGDFVDHNNNFNHGDCGEYANVLDYTKEQQYTKNDNAAHHHADKINLMVNSTTKSFGYYNSNSSVRRTEYTGLVSYKTIMEALGSEADCLEDGWNRSFMGFDFEMMIGDGLYQTDWQTGAPRYVTINDIPGNAPQYIWDGEKVIKWYDYDESYNKVFVEGYDEYIKINGQKIPYLVTNTNMYAGDRLDEQNVLTNITQSNLKVYQDYSNDVKNVECLNLPLIKAAFEAGYYPTKDSAQDWVKVGGTADGYYSDWIVCLTKAEHYDTPKEPEFPTTFSGRIMAEDLNANEKSDFDFNDVVFDWAIVDGKAAIKLLAAGGTKQLKVGGSLVDGEVVGGVEVHAKFGVGVKEMVNTGLVVKPTQKFWLEDKTYASAADISIFVNKDNEWIELTAPVGKAASKINVATTTEWVDEYVDIEKAYPNFGEWVKNASVEWQSNVVSRFVNHVLTDNDDEEE